MFHPPSCRHHCMFPLWTRTWWRDWTVSCVATAQRASRVFASNCCCVWWRWDYTSVCLLGFLCQVILDAPDDARQSCCFSSAWTRSAGHACGKESTRLRVRGPWWSGPGPPEESRLRWNSSGGVKATHSLILYQETTSPTGGDTCVLQQCLELQTNSLILGVISAAGSILSRGAHICTARCLSPLGSTSAHVFQSRSHINKQWTEVF